MHRLNVAPYDNVAPTVSVAFPTQNQEIYALPEIRGTSADVGSGVSEVRVGLWRQVPQPGGTLTEYWDGTKWDPVPSYAGILPPNTETGWTRNQNLPAGAQLPPGDYTVFAHALDRYSNISSNILRNFRVIAVPHLSIDAHLRTTNAEPCLGEGFSNSDAAGQTLGGTIQSGETQTRQIRMVRGGGLESKTVRVTIPDWAAFAAAGWTASFIDEQNNADISAQITSAQGWQTVMNDGDARSFRAEITAPASATAGQTRALTFRVEADPTSETSALDVVKATWSVTATTPDLLIRADNGPWLGETLVNEDGAGQTLERVADSSHVVRGQIKLSVSHAGNGQAVTWSVPDWGAFRADGWNAKFFDARNGNAEITGIITGEGWTTSHINGLEPVINWEITAPTDASDVTRDLSVRAQVVGGVADTVKASVRVLSNAQPDVSVRRMESGPPVGENILSPTPQKLEMVVAVENTEQFAIQISNPTQSATQFLFEPPTLPAGWSYKLYNGLGEGKVELDPKTQSIVTPMLQPNQSVEWLLELDTNASEPEVTVPVRFSGATAFDECQLALQLQGIAGAEYSLDGGATWQTVEDDVLTVPKGSTVGFNAIPIFPNIPWPDDPFEPVWARKDENGKDKIYYGEKVFLQYSTPTPTGEAGDIAKVACGNDFTVKVKVKSEEANQTP